MDKWRPPSPAASTTSEGSPVSRQDSPSSCPASPLRKPASRSELTGFASNGGSCVSRGAGRNAPQETTSPSIVSVYSLSEDARCKGERVPFCLHLWVYSPFARAHNNSVTSSLRAACVYFPHVLCMCSVYSYNVQCIIAWARNVS